jgi:uncharacterized protein (DUF2384 family)
MPDVSVIARAAWNLAVETLGNERKAEIWFHTRLSELEERTPEEVLLEDPMNSEVTNILLRIQDGTFS